MLLKAEKGGGDRARSLTEGGADGQIECVTE